jgi:hypothetical protein
MKIVTPYKLLAKIILTNLWLIARHTELIVEKTQFMYAITIDIPIHLATYIIYVIQKALSDKESSLPFRGLITRVTILVKVPLTDIESTVKMFGKIYVITIVKFEFVVSKKRPFADESTLSQPKLPSTSLLLPLIMDQLQFLTNKFDSFIRR